MIDADPRSAEITGGSLLALKVFATVATHAQRHCNAQKKDSHVMPQSISRSPESVPEFLRRSNKTTKHWTLRSERSQLEPLHV